MSSQNDTATPYDPLPENEFAVDLDDCPTDTRQGKEILVQGDDDAYAGKWTRQLFEGARHNPEQPVWVGFTEPDPLTGPREVPIEFDAQFRHTALFGTTGYGKSTVLKNFMIQWAFGDHGFCFIDPKGGDSKDLMQILPEDRLDDVLWIEPAADDYEKVVGINFLDSSKEYGEDGFEKEAAQIINDIIPILRGDGFWGPRMDEVVRGFLRAMIYLDETYTLADLYQILQSQEDRENFAEKVKAELGDDEGILQNTLEKFAEIDDQDLGAARRRLSQWVMSRETRQVIAHTDAEINITEAVKDGKIIVVRTASISDDQVKRGVATAIIRRIWTAIQMRESIPEPERDPFFLCVDEFDDVAHPESDIGRILSKGRSLKLGVVLANQQPHQINGEIRDDMFGNCDNFLSLNPGHPDDARAITKKYDVDLSTLINLGLFKLCTQIQVNGDQSDVFLTNTFANYPPFRTRDEATDYIGEIIKEYGVDPIEGDSKEEMDDRFKPNPEKSTTSDVSLTIGDTTLDESDVLATIYAAQIRAGGPTAFVGEDQIRAAIEQHVGDVGYGTELSNTIEQIPATNLETKMVDGTPKARLTSHGEQKAFAQDTGQSASGGKWTHRTLLKLTYEAFTRLGYAVTLPKQIGEDQPDGVAAPPLSPMQEADSARELQTLCDQFDAEYPRLADIFEYDELALEAESTTYTKPKQPLKNLAKAMDDGRDCVFIVKDGSGDPDADGFDYYANKLLNVLRNPPYVRQFIEPDAPDAAHDRHFYNKNAKIKLPDRKQMFAIREEGGSAVWRTDGEKLALEDSNSGERLAEFNSIEGLDSCAPSDFPYTYQYDSSQGAVIVRERSGEKVETFSSTADSTPTEVLFDNGYAKIPEPFIPEREFPTGEAAPSEDHWHIVVIPDSDKDHGPRYYDKDDGELKPLLEDDTSLRGDRVDEFTEDADTTTTDQTPHTPESEGGDADDSTAESGEEPRVSDGSKPRSTTEVVKENDDTWTKPEPGDDDYNAAKDNQNYRTGYDEEDAAGDWTGGRAREADKDGEMEEYWEERQRRKHTEGPSEGEDGPDALGRAVVEGMLDNDGVPPEFRDDRHLDADDDSSDDDERDSSEPTDDETENGSGSEDDESEKSIKDRLTEQFEDDDS